jgi:cation:H+ antiporter
VGSNICNIGLILGIGALIRPITVHAQILKREMPLLLLASVVFVTMLWDGHIARWEAGILAVGIVVYVIASIRMARKEPDVELFEEISEEDVKVARKAGLGRIMLDGLLIVIGLVTLIYGADRMVVSGEALARIFGVPEAIIALTLIALGTSLPELATSIVAAVRNHGDIITGNAIGSCMFNILAVIGIAGLVLPMNASELQRSDLWVMLGATVIVFPFLATGKGLGRVEGAVLLIGYLGYCSWLAFG